MIKSVEETFAPSTLPMVSVGNVLMVTTWSMGSVSTIRLFVLMEISLWAVLHAKMDINLLTAYASRFHPTA
jgi:hypothetical protein